MPSPLAHGSLIFLAMAALRRMGGSLLLVQRRPHLFLGGAFFLLVGPDVDFLARTLIDHPAARHGGATHSLLAAMLTTAAFATGCRWFYGPRLPLRPVMLFGFACAFSHLLLDMFTHGRGIMLLWPLTDTRFALIPLFFGARHDQLWAWHLHLITLTSELVFAVIVLWTANRLVRGTGAFAWKLRDRDKVDG